MIKEISEINVSPLFLSDLSGASKTVRNGLDILTAVKNPLLKTITRSLSSIIIIFDVSRMEFLYISDNLDKIMGYVPEEFYGRGFNKILALCPNPEITIKLSNMLNEYLNNYSSSMHDIIFSFSAPNIHHDGTIRWYLHEVIVIDTDQKNCPKLLLASITDIDLCKRSMAVNVVFRIREPDTGIYKTIFKKTFLPESDRLNLTSRELDVLRLMVKGFSSQQIAEKIFLSAHSVYKYRKSMLKKLKAKSAAELIKKASDEGLV